MSRNLLKTIIVGIGMLVGIIIVLVGLINPFQVFREGEILLIGVCLTLSSVLAGRILDRIL